MSTSELFERFSAAIREINADEIEQAHSLPDSLLIQQDRDLATFYSPFDWTNTSARIVLVGITPGLTQAVTALRIAQQELLRGTKPLDALRLAKRSGGFAGSLRPNLVALLDHFGLNRWLGLQTCQSLFGDRSELLHTTSVLRFPTFVGGKNYNGSPPIIRTPMLRTLLLEHFGKEVEQVRAAVLVPLGPTASEALAHLCAEGRIDAARVLDGLPHPSGANAERINYVLGRKQKSALSAKTDAAKLDQAAASLRDRIARLPELHTV